MQAYGRLPSPPEIRVEWRRVRTSGDLTDHSTSHSHSLSMVLHYPIITITFTITVLARSHTVTDPAAPHSPARSLLSALQSRAVTVPAHHSSQSGTVTVPKPHSAARSPPPALHGPEQPSFQRLSLFVPIRPHGRPALGDLLVAITTAPIWALHASSSLR